MYALNESTGSIQPVASARDARARQNFYKGCIEALLMDRKDRTTMSGQNKMAESLNKLLLQNCEIARTLMLKRVSEIEKLIYMEKRLIQLFSFQEFSINKNFEITARMIMISLKPGQSLNLEEPALYIVVDGMPRVSSIDQYREERGELEKLKKRTSQIQNKLGFAVANGLNKFKVAANTLIKFKKLGLKIDDNESSEDEHHGGEFHSEKKKRERDSQLSKTSLKSEGNEVSRLLKHNMTAAESGLIGRSYGIKPGQVVSSGPTNVSNILSLANK